MMIPALSEGDDGFEPRTTASASSPVRYKEHFSLGPHQKLNLGIMSWVRRMESFVLENLVTLSLLPNDPYYRDTMASFT